MWGKFKDEHCKKIAGFFAVKQFSKNRAIPLKVLCKHWGAFLANTLILTLSLNIHRF
jgi:hypothetical protein